ncbi:ComEA family DNA-binding protein [Oceanobacillus sp. 143]|nr:ComEA family DNA-binding protein [Oceanobacillus sp. 143]
MLSADPAVNENSFAVIDVKGAVLKPGVYEISLDSRVNDVILKAGGFTADADQTGVNLAQKVQDEMILVIPKIGEQTALAASSSDDSGKVRINYATQEEIENLNGIGPSKAQAIIAHRDEHGFFQTVEDLLEVSGIGEKTLENMKDSIQVP